MPITPDTTSGRSCGKRVEKGVIAYACILPQGHEFRDAEPCYATEVDKSVRNWQRWYHQKQERLAAERAEEQATPFDQETAAEAAEPSSISIDPRALAVATEVSDADLIAAPSEIRIIADKAEVILAKDPSLTASMALWLACEKVTRKDRE